VGANDVHGRTIVAILMPPRFTLHLAREPRGGRRRHTGMAQPSRIRPSLAVLALLGSILWVGACAGSSRGAPSPRPARVTSVDVEPMRVEVARGAGGTQIEVFDARELFDRAGVALADDRYDEALALYDRLVASFPDSQLVAPALFNAGLALEAKGAMDAAVVRYLEVNRRSGATRHGLDATIRAGAVTAELRRWSDALHLFDQLLARRDLTAADRLEVQARRGYVLVEAGRDVEAESALNAALELAQRGARGQPGTLRYFIAMARYYLAEIPRRQADAVRLDLPDDRLESGLETKAKLVLLAQRRFEDTIRQGDLYWATAAGYQLGAMQQEMWRALNAAPVPRHLAADAAAIYSAEVHALARAHLDKALAAHVMNRKVADHHGAQTPWSDASGERIIALTDLIAREASGPSGAAVPPSGGFVGPRRSGAGPPPPSPARPGVPAKRRIDR
jgi:cellulose synthase operon protein C